MSKILMEKRRLGQKHEALDCLIDEVKCEDATLEDIRVMTYVGGNNYHFCFAIISEEALLKVIAEHNRQLKKQGLKLVGGKFEEYPWGFVEDKVLKKAEVRIVEL